MIRSSFLWQFAGGFALGALGVVSLHPGTTGHRLMTHAERVVDTAM